MILLGFGTIYLTLDELSPNLPLIVVANVLAFTSPETSSFAEGEVFPIPTFPVSLMKK